MNSEFAIKLENISKMYKLYGSNNNRIKEAFHPLRKKYHKEFYALKDINLEIKKGEILGILGRNGSGKSTLLKIISSVLTPNSGNVITNGNIAAILELSGGFNPNYTGLENIYHNLAINGLRKNEINELLEDIIEFSELGDFIYQPIKNYSSGMKAKLAFAVNTSIDPDILILDEVLSVGDALFKRKCFKRMQKFFKSGKTILFVSHSIKNIMEICNSAILLHSGELISQGDVGAIVNDYERILFSEPGKAKSIVNEIKNIKFESSAESSSNNGNGRIRPRTFQENKNYDVEISDWKFYNDSGEDVYKFELGKYYTCKFDVKFNEDFENIKFGFGITNMNSLKIFGAAVPERFKFIEKVKKGESYSVSIRFECLLFQGKYFCEFTVSSDINGKKVFLNKIIDADVFEVISESKNSWGLINLNHESKYQKLER